MNFCTSDLRTTCGSNMLAGEAECPKFTDKLCKHIESSLNIVLYIVLDFKAPYTATSIEHLQNAGAIMGGKVSMDEFGMG